MINNSYPPTLIDKLTDDFITHHGISNNNFKVNPTVQQPKTVKQDHNFFTIPYIGKPSLKLQNKLRQNLQMNGLDIKSAYSTTKVGEYFNLKTKIPSLFKASVTYLFTCSHDENISYIGESRRQFFQRISEHCSSGSKSAVFDHLEICSNCQNATNITEQFKVLQQCKPSHILSAEAMLISKHRPILNTQLGPSKGTAVSLTLYK